MAETIEVEKAEYELLVQIARMVVCYDRDYPTEHDDLIADDFFANAEKWQLEYGPR